MIPNDKTPSQSQPIKRQRLDSPQLSAMDQITNGDSAPAVTHHQLNGIQALPAELLQLVAWYAQNPLLYIVSKAIASKLLPLEDYENDLALLMWCDRYQSGGKPGFPIPAGWSLVVDEAFPWRTPFAKQRNLMLSTQQRLDLQKNIFDLAWLTEQKFKRFAERFLWFWMAYRWNDEDYEEGGKESIQKGYASQYDTVLTKQIQLDPSINFCEDHVRKTGEGMLSISGFCTVYVSPNPEITSPTNQERVVHNLMDTLYISPSVFYHSSCSSDSLFTLLRYTRRRDYNAILGCGPVEFSRELAFAALDRALKDDDIVAFFRLFCLIVSHMPIAEVTMLHPSLTDIVFLQVPGPHEIGTTWLVTAAFGGDSLDRAPLDRSSRSCRSLHGLLRHETSHIQSLFELFKAAGSPKRFLSPIPGRCAQEVFFI